VFNEYLDPFIIIEILSFEVRLIYCFLRADDLLRLHVKLDKNILQLFFAYGVFDIINDLRFNPFIKAYLMEFGTS